MRLEGKVALISGGARGMGAAEARLFAREGASVVIGDLLEEESRRVEAQIGEAGGHALFLRLDVTSESGWISAVAAAVSRFGKLDVLVNNAGVGGGGGMVEDTTVEAWDIGYAAVYLASDEARWVSGIVLPVDAGLLTLSPVTYDTMSQQTRY